jgi:glycosyltransferase involved in cell wall biosynthesis
VLIVTQYFWPEVGAPQVRYDAITSTLVALGVRVDVLTGMPNYPSGHIRPGYGAWRPRVEERNGVRIHRLPLFAYGGANKWLRLLNHGSLAASAFGGLLMDLDPDIVIVESPPLPLVLPAAAIARRRGAPLVVYVSDLWPAVPLAMGALRPGFAADRFADLESLCYRFAWRITVTSEGQRDAIAAHPMGGPQKVVMLPNGFDPAVFHPYDRGQCEAARARLRPLDDRALFIYAGTIGQAQALDTVVETATHLRNDQRVGFVLIGDGPERERLALEAKRRGLDNILFLASVPPTEVPCHLAFARASLAPLRDITPFEGTRPGKVVISLACGTPVIFSGRGEVAALITREECGIVVPPEDPAALTGAVLSLTERPEDAAAMGKRGRALAMRDFDFPALVRRWWDELLRDLSAPKGALPLE